MEHPITYIPIDRRHALARKEEISEMLSGSALFADISGFTPLSEALAVELGANRGAEELTLILNQIFDAIISDLHRFGGAVMTFSGDAVTCWLDQDDGSRGIACALAMQQTMRQFKQLKTPGGRIFSLAMKTAVTTGPVRRYEIGSREHLLMDILTGGTLEILAEAEHLSLQDELVVDRQTVSRLRDQLEIKEWRQSDSTLEEFAVVAAIKKNIQETPWEGVPVDAISAADQKSWLLPDVYGRVKALTGEFLAELRPISALFLRFGEIDYDHDPLAGEKLNNFIVEVQVILARYESNILQVTVGDKGSYLYAAFGAPLIHENDPQRAVAAALELQDAAQKIHKLNQIQIGITTGRAWTGAYGSVNRRTYGVLGDVVNLSARLMMAAKPNQILADRNIYLATRNIADWNQLPKIKVKGKNDPIEIFELKGLKKPKSSRLQAPKYNFHMVGRQSELNLIEKCINKTLSGEGQIIGLSGEAGIGKSRLVANVIDIANERGVTGLGGECQSYGTNSSYLVWQSIWHSFFGLDSNLSQSALIQILTLQLQQIDPELVPRMPLLGNMVGLLIPDNEFTQSFDAKLRKDSLHSLLIDCLQSRSPQQPLLIVLEDCHWMDPLSVELLNDISRAIANLPILILMAYRPVEWFQEETAEILKRENFTSIKLDEFSSHETVELVQLKLLQLGSSQTQPPKAFVDQVVERTQGNPFYIEELLNYLYDRKIDPADIDSLATIDLPTSLHSLVLSRIDQLNESERITIKVASVIGRLFKAAMLFGVYPQRDDVQEIKSDLDRLTQLDMTIQDFETPELTYLFKNVVTREVTYENLPYETRATLHNQVGNYIEKTFADNLTQYVDLLAHHYSLSRNLPKKRLYLQKAAIAAQERFANDVAIDYFERVLPLLDPAEKIDTLLRLGGILELVGKWENAGQRYREALTLAQEKDDVMAVARARTVTADLLRKRGNYQDAAQMLMLAQSGFESVQNQEGLGETLHIAGTLAAQQGDFETAKEIYRQSLEIRRALGADELVAALLSNLGIVARYEGQYEEAMQLHQEALELRRQLSDQRGISVSLNNLGNVALDQGNLNVARKHIEEGLEILRKIGDTSSTASNLNNLGNVLRDQGEYETARKLYVEGLSINATLGYKWALAYLFEDMGCLEAMLNQPERAAQLIGAASLLRQEIGAPLSDAEHQKLEGKITPAKEMLTTDRWTVAFLRGQTLPLQDMIAFAKEPPV